MATKDSIIRKIHQRGVMAKFGEELVRQFHKNLGKTDIGRSGQLGRSFKYRLHFDSQRNVKKLSFSHLEYGVFVDMGVSRGVSLDDIGTQRIDRTLLGRKIGERRAKRWYYKKIHGQTIRFADIVMSMRGLEYRVAIESAIDEIADVSIEV